MDASKAQQMHKVSFTIQNTCALCLHSRFDGGVRWGLCVANNYVHDKHTGVPRQMSCHVSGHCSKFEPYERLISIEIGKYTEFMEV